MVLHNPNKPTQAQPGLNIIRRLLDQEAKKEQLNAPRQNPSHQRVPACYLMVFELDDSWSTRIKAVLSSIHMPCSILSASNAWANAQHLMSRHESTNTRLFTVKGFIVFLFKPENND
ncbi:hypothetical protein D5086_011088 [Populus alba]|uniref:Uncharacterized protein n=2 Tax=Populus alba TaxID=43335 RepID=A0A4U5PUH5_POPAL|nr:hypothetical protein D5086_0000180900 [Populus alba]